MADEYRQLIVSADQIDTAVQWVEANKVNIIKKLETLDTEVLQLSEDVLLIKGLDLQHMQNDVDDLKSNLSTLDAEVLQLTEDVLLIKGLDLQHMKSDIEDLQANTYTKTETDTKITEKVSELIANAPAEFDTLKEMSDWLLEHEDSAAAMNSAIQKNAEDIATANTNISKNTADITTANAAITKNASDISAANTNIQKNVDDITAVKNSIAINKSTLGVQCKNLFKPKQNAGYTQTVSGVSYTFNDDGSITASGTLTGEAALNFSEIYLEAGEYRISSSKFLNVQIYKSNSYVGNSQVTPEGKVITISESGTYSFRWYWGAAGTVVNGTIYPMLTYAEITDVTYEPFKNNDFNTRVSTLETLSDVVYKCNNSSRCNIDGYALRVGNQIHLNLTVTFHSACESWWGGVLNFPFKVKTPDGSGRYTIKQTQSDGRETSVYISNGSNGIYTSTAFQKDDVITFPPMILDMYVEEATTTEGGE